MKNILTYKDLENKYTETVSKYLSQGLTISTSTMSGTQGEIAKIDLKEKDGQIIRVLFYKENGIELDKKVIEVRKYPAPKNSNTTLWNNQGELVEEVEFFEIGKYNQEAYTMTKEVAIEARDKHYSRLGVRNNDRLHYVPFDSELVLNIVKNQKGFKSVRKTQIASVARYNNELRYVIYIDCQNGAKRKTVSIGR